MPHYEECPEPSPSHRSSRKGSLPKVILGLALLLLSACAGASITAESDPSRPTAVGAEAASTGLVEPSRAPSPQTAARSGAPAETIPQQDSGSVRPAVIPTAGNAAESTVVNAGEESVPASPAPAVAARPIGNTPREAPQLEPESATAIKHEPAEAAPQPLQEPLQVPAHRTEDPSPQASLPRAPAFTLTSASGEPVSLETYRGQSNVVLVFYRGFW